MEFTIDKFTKEVAEKALDEITYEGKTVREWVEIIVKQQPIENVFDNIKAEIMDCLNALDEIEKTGLNIYLPNEISGRRLTYQQCLEIIDKYRKGGAE